MKNTLTTFILMFCCLYSYSNSCWSYDSILKVKHHACILDTVPDKPTPPPPPPPPAREKIYVISEEMPRFPGCENKGLDKRALEQCAMEKMLEFIYKNLEYPPDARNNGIQGTSVVQFIVKKDGSIQDIVIVRDPGGGLGEEAKRVVELMNHMDEKWIPGKQKGRAVYVKYSMPVKFTLM